jgi:DNA polymerase-3 subunit delta
MKVAAGDLPERLKKALPAVLVLSSDEPLLLRDAADAVRAAALAQGYDERISLHAGTGFDWGQLAAQAGSLSLFSSRRLLDLRLPSGKPGVEGAKALQTYAQQAPAGTLLLLSLPKLDSKSGAAAWVRALEQAGWWVSLWPLRPAEFPGWLKTRMQRAGFQPTPAAVEFLAQQVEGNLLAAAQEVEKLSLLLPAGPLDVPQVQSAVADSSRYTAFQWCDAVLAGEGARAVRILLHLKAEGEEPLMLLGALLRELRALALVARSKKTGESLRPWLERRVLWESKLPQYEQALRRRWPWGSLFRRAARVDRAVKTGGRPWDELLQFAAELTTPLALPMP